MQIELSDKLQNALEQAAASAGMSVSRYAGLLMEEQLAQDSQRAILRSQAIDALIEHMKTAASASGRERRGWREFIHEGHAV
ncbi:hypothetical protein [Paracidobacterium acidisoli]|uniref:Uncharacterized protein n=1 Tax=Paracidobacterium acidisoli TaxID=2303751 RepID=A0A372IK52_9BACT|nr:hypothetical protein [Paracidobacterium acidisoli]MBT9333185.1 hypothetical protein [Paracidobacterium acidisoli]